MRLFQRKPKRLESDIKREIIHYINLKYGFVWNNRNTGVYIAKTGHYIPAPTRGVPDIIGYTDKRALCGPGKFIGIEVKRPEDKNTIEAILRGEKPGHSKAYHIRIQNEFLRGIKEAGGIALFGYAIEGIDIYFK